MKNIGQLLSNIQNFVILAETRAKHIEHALQQAESRARNPEGKPDPRLGKLAVEDVLRIIYKIQSNKQLFDKIPAGSKWIIETFGQLNAVVEKIYEEGGLKLILKTFLEPGMVETGVQGRLIDFLKRITDESKSSENAAKLVEKRKILKAVEKLFNKKLPISIDQLKKNNPTEYTDKLSGLFQIANGGIITLELVRKYKQLLESEIQKLTETA